MLVTVSAAEEAKEPAFKTFEEKFAYAIGVEMGSNLKENAIELDLDSLVKGMTDGYNGNELAMTQEEIAEVSALGMEKLKAKAQAKHIADIADNLAKGEKFLADNKTRKGVKTTDSGLQYEVITEGKGEMPKATDKVSVHYTGTLIDGTVFDSSYKRNQPATFQVGGVIRGWVEALQMMKTGSKWKLYIPTELAYGERGAGREIGPNETLIFEVELLEILPAPEAAE
jgi:FKBP-type peptidyl-prolyl cis-trans isomerase